MAIELISCPACGRKNASHRATCHSCRANLPTSNANEQKEVAPPWPVSLWHRIRTGWYSHRATPANPPASPEPRPQAAPPPAPPSGDPFLEEIISEKQRVDRQIGAATQEHQRQAEERLSEAHEIMERLGQFARDNEQDKTLIALWEEIKHYPSWSQREDFGRWNKLELADVVGSRKENVESVEFTYAGQRFILSARRDHDIVGDSYVELSFYEDGTEVFAIRCSEHDKYGVTDYLCDYVSAFKKRGNWAKVLLRLYEQIQIAHKKSSADANDLVAKDIKSRFKE